MQAFLEFTNFYYQFIYDFSVIVCPLFDLTKSNMPWSWSKKKHGVFEALKATVTSAPVLVSPQDLQPFHIETNSLDFTTRAVLFQQLPRTKKWHPVVFYSKFLSLVEWNYKIHDKEMLAIIHTLKE